MERDGYKINNCEACPGRPDFLSLVFTRLRLQDLYFILCKALAFSSRYLVLNSLPSHGSIVFSGDPNLSTERGSSCKTEFLKFGT